MIPATGESGLFLFGENRQDYMIKHLQPSRKTADADGYNSRIRFVIWLLFIKIPYSNF